LGNYFLPTLPSCTVVYSQPRTAASDLATGTRVYAYLSHYKFSSVPLINRFQHKLLLLLLYYFQHWDSLTIGQQEQQLVGGGSVSQSSGFHTMRKAPNCMMHGGEYIREASIWSKSTPGNVKGFLQVPPTLLSCKKRMFFFPSLPFLSCHRTRLPSPTHFISFACLSCTIRPHGAIYGVYIYDTSFFFCFFFFFWHFRLLRSGCEVQSTLHKC